MIFTITITLLYFLMVVTCCCLLANALTLSSTIVWKDLKSICSCRRRMLVYLAKYSKEIDAKDWLVYLTKIEPNSLKRFCNTCRLFSRMPGLDADLAIHLMQIQHSSNEIPCCNSTATFHTVKASTWLGLAISKFDPSCLNFKIADKYIRDVLLNHSLPCTLESNLLFSACFSPRPNYWSSSCLQNLANQDTIIW